MLPKHLGDRLKELRDEQDQRRRERTLTVGKLAAILEKLDPDMRVAIHACGHLSDGHVPLRVGILRQDCSEGEVRTLCIGDYQQTDLEFGDEEIVELLDGGSPLGSVEWIDPPPREYVREVRIPDDFALGLPPGATPGDGDSLILDAAVRRGMNPANARRFQMRHDPANRWHIVTDPTMPAHEPADDDLDEVELAEGMDY